MTIFDNYESTINEWRAQYVEEPEMMIIEM